MRGRKHKKNPRPRTNLPRTELLEAKDNNALGQEQKTPRGTVLKKKKSLRRKSQICCQISGKEKKLSWPRPTFNKSKKSAVLDRGQAFSRTCILRGQGLHNVSSRQGRLQGLHLWSRFVDAKRNKTSDCPIIGTLWNNSDSTCDWQ